MNREIVELDVGGKLFRTTASTLTSQGGFFAAMLRRKSEYVNYEDEESDDDDQQIRGDDGDRAVGPTINLAKNIDGSRCWNEGLQTSAETSAEVSADCLSPQSANSRKVPKRRSGKSPIFIDRDPTVFEDILSYLRSGTFFISPGDDDLHLKRLAVEADFYQLNSLSEAIEGELEQRSNNTNSEDKSKYTSLGDEFKVVNCAELSFYFERGWEFVDKFLGDETTACAVTGVKVKASWRGNHCSACGQSMTCDKYTKHVSYVQPTMIVLRRKQHSFRRLAVCSSGGGSNSSSGSSHVARWTIDRNHIVPRGDYESATPHGLPLHSNLEFDVDASFG